MTKCDKMADNFILFLFSIHKKIAIERIKAKINLTVEYSSPVRKEYGRFPVLKR
jgi:hypothetical protein